MNLKLMVSDLCVGARCRTRPPGHLYTSLFCVAIVALDTWSGFRRRKRLSVCVCVSVCVYVRMHAEKTHGFFVSYFIKNLSKMVSRAALDGSRDQRNWSFYDVNWTFCKKGCVFAREWRTSMSPRSNEKHTFFENWNMYGAVCRFFSCGACGPFRVLKMMHWNYNLVFS